MNGAERSRIDRRDRAQRRRRNGMRVHDSARTLALLRRDGTRRREVVSG
ncbi:MAG: hypothetical protein ACREQM_13555 [Candidatus Dormibacteraceae bacterium]